MVTRFHLSIIAACALLASPLTAQTTYHSAGSQTVTKQGGSGSVPFYGWCLNLNETMSGGFGNGGDQTFTTPTRTSPYTWYWCTADSAYDTVNRKPLVVVMSVPVGSGQTPRRGTYGDVGGQWLPLDDETGVPFNPETGEDIPGLYKDGFEVENPFTDRPFEFDLVMTDPETGEVISEGTYKLGPGATMPFDLVADRPYDWAVYPRVDGTRSPTPYQSGSGAYGGSGSTGGSSGSPGTVGGPPLMHNDSPTTSGNTPQPAAPAGDLQAEVKRLADLMQQTEDAQRTNANLQFDELTKLNATATGSKLELGEIRETIEQGNGILAAIEANTGATAENTEGGGTGGMTQGQFEETIDADGLTVETGDLTPIGDTAGLMAALWNVKAAFDGLAGVTFAAPSGTTSLSFSVPTPVGAVSLNLEQFSDWFAIARMIVLFLAFWWFLQEVLATVRDTF